MTRIIDVVTSGASHRPALFLVHPMGADASFWADFTALMSDDFFCIAPTQYGAGRSPDITEPLSIDGHAQDIEALREQLGLSRMVVIGCAIGAMIGARFADLYPEHVSALVMTNPGLRTRGAAKQALANRARLVREGGMDAVIPMATDAAFFGRPEDERKSRYVETFRAQNASNYAATLESILNADLSESYQRLQCPVLLVPGGNDRLFTPDHADEIAPLIRDVETVTLAEGAHFIPYQCPDELAHLVKDFLGRHAVL